MTGPDAQPIWTTTDQVLRIREHGKVTASDELIAQIDQSAWADLGISVRRSPEDRYWTVSASQYAGVARIETANKRPMHVEITPKIDHLDLFFLADWAYSATGAAHRPQPAHLDVLRTDPAACVLGWYLQTLIDFATRWIRRGYVVREEDLVARVRGRVLVDRYARSLAVARAHVIPCRYAEPTQDTALNQYLKAGLRRTLALIPALPIAAARLHLQRLGLRALALFSGITDLRLTAQDANRLSPAGPHRHYRPLINTTRAILAGSYLGPTAGQQVQDSFIYNVNTLFQEALRNILASWPGSTLDRRRAKARLVDESGAVLRRQSVLPDYVVAFPGRNQRILLDAKYTSINMAPADDDELTFAEAGEQIRVRRSEVYQAVSYAHHERWAPTSVALVYPVSLAVGQNLPRPLHIDGFNTAVYLMFLDVGPAAHTNIASFYETLDQTLGHSPSRLNEAPTRMIEKI